MTKYFREIGALFLDKWYKNVSQMILVKFTNGQLYFYILNS